MSFNFGHIIKSEWLLDEQITFLNNGSFGSAPRIVLEEYDKLNRLIEKEPIEFFMRHYFQSVRESASKLAKFLGVDSNDLVFVENATAGVNTILNSYSNSLKLDDEIIFTNHIYPAVCNTLKHLSLKTGVRLNEVYIPYPLEDVNVIISKFQEIISPRTKLAVIDHIASATSIIFPIKEIIDICQANGTLTLIDGAHCPGMIDLNISELGADFYVGNCHKWLYTIKGTALLYCRKELQENIHPLVISLDYGNGFTKEFDWVGTRNPCSWLSVKKALEFYLSKGKDEIISYIHNLTLQAGKMIIEEFQIDMHINEKMYGAMISFPIILQKNSISPFELRNLFYDKYKIEVPFFNFDNSLLFRISAQIYNEISDYENLIIALRKEFYS